MTYGEVGAVREIHKKVDLGDMYSGKWECGIHGERHLLKEFFYHDSWGKWGWVSERKTPEGRGGAVRA